MFIFAHKFLSHSLKDRSFTNKHKFQTIPPNSPNSKINIFRSRNFALANKIYY